MVGYVMFSSIYGFEHASIHARAYLNSEKEKRELMHLAIWPSKESRQK